MRVVLLLLAVLASPLAAQPAPPPSPPTAAPPPVTVESYYRIRWGSFWDFMEIYSRHHAPILAELQRRGFITAMRVETPSTHMAGDQRWDLRVTIVYRGAAGADPAYDRAVREISDRLYTDRAAHLAAETRRFGMLEEHWDVLVAPYSE